MVDEHSRHSQAAARRIIVRIAPVHIIFDACFTFTHYDFSLTLLLLQIRLPILAPMSVSSNPGSLKTSEHHHWFAHPGGSQKFAQLLVAYRVP
jgi:hypothetical protein